MGKFICAQTPGNADVLELRQRPTPPQAGRLFFHRQKWIKFSGYLSNIRRVSFS